MTAVPVPRRTFHRGFVAAAGFWFDPSLIGAERTADRILSLWSEGCVIHSAAGGVLLVLPSPILVESRGGPGVVLTRRDGILAGSPVTKSEMARLGPPPGSALLCREGRILVCPLTRETMLDPALWLDVNDLEARTSRPLGDPPAPAAASRGTEPPPLESHFDPELTRPPEEKIRLLSALRKAAGSRGAGPRWPEASPRTEGTGWAFNMQAILYLLLVVLAGLSLYFGDAAIFRITITLVLARVIWRLAAGRAGGAAAPGEGLFHRSVRGSAPSRGSAPGRRFLGALLFRSRSAARFFGRRQGRYLEKMTRLFEDNDLDQALRFAIPLATLGKMVRLLPAFLPPRPRANLSIGLDSPNRAVRVMALSRQYELYLTDLYRQASRRLEQAGEIDKAAFVLLELLKQNEEAIALLERHGRFRFAAEVAQARGLPPGMVIRLWFLAGEPAQAVRLARTTGAFADAIIRLEATHPAEAAKLRVLWAGFLAEAGNYGAAVDAAWPVPEARRLMLEWIDRGIRLEGAIAARLIVKKIALDPDSLEGLLPSIRGILTDTLPGGLRAKLSLGKAIMEHEDRQDLRGLSGFVLRHLLKDLHAVPFNPGFESVVRALKKTTLDRVLIEDLPSHEFPIPAAGSQGSLAFRRDAADIGLRGLCDGVCLPSGRLVVALGEAGVQVLSRRGALVAHLDCPADRLVVNDSGNRVIAMAKRGSVSRLARIDLETLRQRYWCDALIDNTADTFDGEVWYVSHEDSVMAIDALADRFESIWRVGDLKGPVLAMARSSSALSLVVGVPGEPERWRYDVPAMMLRQRYGMFKEEGPPPEGTVLPFPPAAELRIWAVTAKDHYGICRPKPAAPEAGPDRFFVGIGMSGQRYVWRSRDLEEVPTSFCLYEHVCAVTAATAEGLRIYFFRWSGEDSEPAVVLDLAGARSASVRRYANTFCVTDDCGRVLVLSAEDLRLIREAKL